MTGTPSRTATASPRGGVGRKLKANPWPEEHETYMRRRLGGRESVGSCVFFMNRRIPNGTSGGVGAGAANRPGDPIVLFSKKRCIIRTFRISINSKCTTFLLLTKQHQQDLLVDQMPFCSAVNVLG